MRTMITAICAFAVCLAVSAGEFVLPDRLPEARPGEWLLIQDVHNLGAASKISVARVNKDKGEIVLLRENLDGDGKVLDSKELEIDLARHSQRRAELEKNAKQISRERLFVKDKEITAYAVAWDQEGEDGKMREFKVWISPELPVGGIAKSWSSDPEMPALEVVDFGF